MAYTTKNLPSVPALQNDIIRYSKTSRKYEFLSTAYDEHEDDGLYHMPLWAAINAVFPYYYEWRASNAYLLLYTRSGQGRITFGDKSILLVQNSLLFLSCEMDFILELSEANSWNHDFMLLSGTGVSSYYKFHSSEREPLIQLSPISRIPSYFTQIAGLYAQKDHECHYTFLLSNLISGLLTAILVERDHTAAHTLQAAPHLVRIKKRFDEEYNQEFTLDEIANAEHISKYKFVRDFSACYGISPISYLIEVRIQHARQLLADSSDPINEIAAAVGIDNMNHFIYLFKKSTGITPSGYRKACFQEKRHWVE